MNLIKNNAKKILLLAFILMVGFFVYRAKTAPNPNTVYLPKKDQLVTPKRQDIADKLDLAGSVDAASLANLQFQTPGQLAWVGVKIGDHVKKWQAVASLDKSQLQQQFQTAMNNYLANRSTFEDTQDQYKTTKDKYLVTDAIQRILDRTQWSLNNSVLNVQAADLAVKYATLVSPIDGIVTAVDQPNPGVNVTPLTANYTIVDPNSIYFKTEIDQETVSQVHQGQAAVVKLDAFPDQSIDSVITYISFAPVAGQTSTVYQVRFQLPVKNDALIYRLGMDGNASIIVAKSANALTVPTDAVNDDGSGNKYVYLKNEKNVLLKTPVTTGIETDTLTEITHGLTANDQVVIKKR